MCNVVSPHLDSHWKSWFITALKMFVVCQNHISLHNTNPTKCNVQVLKSRNDHNSWLSHIVITHCLLLPPYFMLSGSCTIQIYHHHHQIASCRGFLPIHIYNFGPTYIIYPGNWTHAIFMVKHFWKCQLVRNVKSHFQWKHLCFLFLEQQRLKFLYLKRSGISATPYLVNAR